MMQVIKDTRQCFRCGCIALPDATKCPKCGAAYNGNGTNGNGAKQVLEPISYLTESIAEDVNTKVVRAHYQLTCGRHGKIHVKATVISSPIKCPFCR